MSLKVLIIDDSPMVRRIFTKELAKDFEIEVVGSASNAFIGRKKIIELEPDIILLDIEMPGMDGLTFLEKLMRHNPMPVIIVSSLVKKGGDIALRAIELGAAEVIAKPCNQYPLEDMSEQLIEKIKAVALIKKQNIGIAKKYNPIIKKNQKNNTNTSSKIIAIGASTGGVNALKEILTQLPSDMPPILIVQHMSPCFTKSFADRLNELSELNIKEAENYDKVVSGQVLIAPGNKHMLLKKNEFGKYYVELTEGPLVFHQRPSIEILFDSVAGNAGENSIGVILTGMGMDGAGGLLGMRDSGAYTIAQDEESCIVFGMPKEAISINAAVKIESLSNIPQLLVKLTRKQPAVNTLKSLEFGYV